MAAVHLNISVDFEGCDESTIESVDNVLHLIKRALVQSVEQTGAEFVVTRKATEAGESTEIVEVKPATTRENESKAALESLKRENDFLKQLLLDADEVARRRGDTYGLCDSLTNDDKPYPSASAADFLDNLKRQGRKPMLFLKDLGNKKRRKKDAAD